MIDHADKGAHFFKCDFQVHTPRDAAWQGQNAVTNAERAAYATELIQACRAKELDAIAVTDHHDFVFFPYIKAAAASEIGPTGERIPKQQQIVVFPGIEITLSSPPCQALLLLDADFDESRLQDVLTILAITSVDAADARVPAVVPISPDAINSLNDLERKFNQQSWLKGKYILLPNVTDGGHKSLLREGFHQHYKEMHCVGGYVDGDFDARTGVGKRNILEGRQQNQGYPGKGVIQTSDSRSRNHAKLGAHVTYIKWSEPTAEAIRQACLARESRLSLAVPSLPGTWIKTLTVSNSKFLGRISLDFNQQYSVMIGGRGTGKSTVLEYLRWGLCDQPTETDDIDLVQGKRRALIERTLGSLDAVVFVEFSVNGVPHVARRSVTTREIALKIANDDFRMATEEQIRDVLPIQAYSQKQLSSVGVRIDELRRFVELPIREALELTGSDARDIEAKMRGAYGSLRRLRELSKELDKNEVELSSLAEQLGRIRNDLKGLSEAETKTIAYKQRFENEEVALEGFRRNLEDAQRLISSTTASIGELADSFGVEEEPDFVNPALVDEIRSAYASKFDQLKVAASELGRLLQAEDRQEIDAAISRWSAKKAAFDAEYRDAFAKAKVNQQQLDQIAGLEKRIAVVRKELTEKHAAAAALGKPEEEYKSQRDRWDRNQQEKIEALEAQCGLLTTLSEGSIRATVRGQIDSARLQQGLKSAFSGMNIREDKIENICKDVLKAEDTFAQWNAVLTELELLAAHDADAPGELPDTPILNRLSFIGSERRRIASGFGPDRWIELAAMEFDFVPKFEYCTNAARSEFIAFADASAGQQATALLTVLLNQPGAPLIIDQPEDDIDSKLFREVVARLWKAKTQRQLIFSSHSANFVVNGDAELVVCCDYTKAGDQTQGTLKVRGAIDNGAIREEIILVTEGGRDAFKLRMDQYGF